MKQPKRKPLPAPRRKAELSLQFFRDKRKDCMGFTVTSQLNGDLFNKSSGVVDHLIFGNDFAGIDFLTKQEKLWVCSVFKEAERILRNETAKS